MNREFIGNLLTQVVNWSLTRLRNGQEVNFSREELRVMGFSFGQYGEDAAALRWANMLDIRDGIYLDIGAYDPVLNSNTLPLFRRGWKGINIDMNTERIEKFKTRRPRDYSIVAAVSDQKHQVEALSYPAGATDRISTPEETSKLSCANERPVSKETLTTTTLTDILGDCPFDVPRLDYINIDAEGHDLQILKGLDMNRYRPAIVSIEAWEPEEEQKITDYLSSHNYRLEEILFRTFIFVDSNLKQDRTKLYQ